MHRRVIYLLLLLIRCLFHIHHAEDVIVVVAKVGSSRRVVFSDGSHVEVEELGVHEHVQICLDVVAFLLLLHDEVVLGWYGVEMGDGGEHASIGWVV